MRPCILCLERLDRLTDVLARQGGSETLRQLFRRFGIHDWEVEQAAALGWVAIETRKPHTGRPSLVARILSETQTAKLPPPREEIGRSISCRHRNFAFQSVLAFKHAPKSHFPNLFGGFSDFTSVYLRCFPSARSRAGASASVSRLLHHPDVKAARAWLYALTNQEIPHDEAMPETAIGIQLRLYEARKKASLA